MRVLRRFEGSALFFRAYVNKENSVYMREDSPEIFVTKEGKEYVRGVSPDLKIEIILNYYYYFNKTIIVVR